jgi:hypothetical protein
MINLDEIEEQAVKVAKEMVKIRGNPHWHDMRDMYMKGYRAAEEESITRIADLVEAVQKHAEGGNIENYGNLSDKIEALSKGGEA